MSYHAVPEVGRHMRAASTFIRISRKKSNYDCAFAIVPSGVARLRIRLSEPDELPEVIRHKH